MRRPHGAACLLLVGFLLCCSPDVARAGFLDGISNALSSAVGTVTGGVTSAAGTVANATEGAVDTVTSGVDTAADSVSSALNTATGAVQQGLDTASGCDSRPAGFWVAVAQRGCAGLEAGHCRPQIESPACSAAAPTAPVSGTWIPVADMLGDQGLASCHCKNHPVKV